MPLDFPPPGPSPHDGPSRRGLLAVAIAIAADLGAGDLAASAKPIAGSPTFYDPRFASARGLAARLAAGGALIPIQGDVTELAASLGQGPLLRPPIVLRGVTTETPPFCLAQVLKGRLRQRRLDQDLFAWSLELRSA